MNIKTNPILTHVKLITMSAMLMLSCNVEANANKDSVVQSVNLGSTESEYNLNKASGILDNFSDQTKNSFGVERQFLNDSIAGGQTNSSQTIIDGKLQIKGNLVPPRGQPGWASTVFLLNPDNTATDLSRFQGVKLSLKVNKGNVSISANSTEVTNFDYHAAFVTVQADNNFHEVTIPFSSMKRTWSEQTQLNKQTINSLSLVAFAMKQEPFDFAVNEISFY